MGRTKVKNLQKKYKDYLKWVDRNLDVVYDIFT